MSNDVPFHATRMGQTYYEHTLPELVRQITRLAEAVERLAAENGAQDDPGKPETPVASSPRTPPNGAAPGNASVQPPLR